MNACLTDAPRLRRGDLNLLPTDNLTALVTLGKAIGDPIRLQMLYLLGQYPVLCTCEFADLLDLGQSKVSYHLKILLDAGLVSRETYGTWSHYRLVRPDLLTQLAAMLPTHVLAAALA